MHDPARSLTVATATDPVQAQLAVDQARALFQRALSAWVCDLLILRRAGRDSPGWPTEHESQQREAA
jgi:hypothetical protein